MSPSISTLCLANIESLSRYKVPNSNMALKFLTFGEHASIDPPTFRVLVINAIHESCRKSIANLPFPETKTWVHRNMDIEIDCFSGVGIPQMTWESACVMLRGLLDYQESAALGNHKDQIFQVHIARYYVAVGRISLPASTIMSSERLMRLRWLRIYGTHSASWKNMRVLSKIAVG